MIEASIMNTKYYPVLIYRTVRTGVLAIKIGVQPIWTKEGKKIMTTLLQVGFFCIRMFCIISSEISMFKK